MANRCEGFNATDTASCEECHRQGGTWVIRPDGSMICSHAAIPEDWDDETWSNRTGPSGTALLIALLTFGAVVVASTRL